MFVMWWRKQKGAHMRSVSTAKKVSATDRGGVGVRNERGTRAGVPSEEAARTTVGTRSTAKDTTSMSEHVGRAAAAPIVAVTAGVAAAVVLITVMTADALMGAPSGRLNADIAIMGGVVAAGRRMSDPWTESETARTVPQVVLGRAQPRQPRCRRTASTRSTAGLHSA